MKGKFNMKGHLVTRNLHIAQKAYAMNIPLIPKLIWIMNRIVFSCDISASVKTGKCLQLYHNGLGVVIHPKTIIGNNCAIYQNVTLGGNGKKDKGISQSGAPTLEDNVKVFCGACVLGPITIGHDSYIGANAVVTKNVPPDSLVFGNPCQIVKRSFEI